MKECTNICRDCKYSYNGHCGKFGECPKTSPTTPTSTYIVMEANKK